MGRIRRYLNAIPLWAELAIVAVLAFGLPIAGSIAAVLAGSSEGSISEAGLHALIIEEAFVLAVLSLFLFFRGWTPHRIGMNAGLVNTAIGLLMAFAISQVYGLAV